MQERIGFGKRFGAVIIDAIIIGIFGFIAGKILLPSPEKILADIMTSGGDMLSAMSIGAKYAAMSSGISGIIGCLYGLQDVFMAGTLGKSLLKITIRAEDASPAAQNALWTRYLLKYSYYLISILGLLGLTFIAYIGWAVAAVLGIWTLTTIFGPTAQAAWDNIAKTAVYDKEAAAV